MDAAFAFPLVSAIRSFDKTKIVAAIDKLEKAIPPGKHELVFVENHDMPRIASDPGITPEKLRTAATLAMLLKSTPLIYYGQELGMRGIQRPEYKSDEKDIGTREAFEWSAKIEAQGEATWYKGPEELLDRALGPRRRRNLGGGGGWRSQLAAEPLPQAAEAAPHASSDRRW